MKFINTATLEKATPYLKLVQALKTAFCENITVPLRHHHQYENPFAHTDSTLLLMPAWQSGEYLGVKIVTVSPENYRLSLPSINGTYLLFDARTGIPIAQMDAKVLTNRRTAAASALASNYLARKDSSTLLMVGTGALAPCLIAAHAAIRPIKKVLIWGRNQVKAQVLATTLKKKLAIPIIASIKNIQEGIAAADIISCATLSNEPLLLGQQIQPGQHIDLVGSYKPDMREADNRLLQKASIYVDTMEGACKETGDIIIPLHQGIIQKTDLKADLFALCQADVFQRKSDSEITLFKSVGHALEDLAAARLVFLNG